MWTDNRLKNVHTSIKESNNNTQLARTLDQECLIFRQSKQIVKQGQEKIMHTIKQGTTREVQEVERAVKALNDKVKHIMETPEVQKTVDMVNKNRQQMYVSLQQAIKVFQDGQQTIRDDPSLSPEQKKQYQKAMYEKVLSKLYTPQEIQAFQQMFAGTVVIVPSGLQGGQPRLGLPGSARH
jgi:hypothetical protein